MDLLPPSAHPFPINFSNVTKRETLLKVVQSFPEIVEEVKWKKPSNPLGVPVWSLEGIICIGNILKKAVRLTFSKGSQISDPSKLFNTRLDSKTVRAVDFFEGDRIDEKALTKIVQRAVTLNLEKSKLKK